MYFAHACVHVWACALVFCVKYLALVSAASACYVHRDHVLVKRSAYVCMRAVALYLFVCTCVRIYWLCVYICPGVLEYLFKRIDYKDDEFLIFIFFWIRIAHPPRCRRYSSWLFGWTCPALFWSNSQRPSLGTLCSRSVSCVPKNRHLRARVWE